MLFFARCNVYFEFVALINSISGIFNSKELSSRKSLHRSGSMDKHKRLLISLHFLFLAVFSGQMIEGAVGIAVPIYANLLGASLFLVGLVGAAGGLTYSFMPLVSGTLSDRLKRKVFISGSMILYGFSCTLYIFAEDPFLLVFIKALERISVATFWPAVEALLADMSEENLEDNLKKFNISWGSAMVIGPLIGGLLISGYTVKAPLLFSLAISIPLGILSFMLVKEPPRVRDRTRQEGSQVEGRLNSPSSMIVALSSVFLFSSINGIIVSLFPAYATDLGIPAYEIGLIMFINGASRAITFYLAKKIEAKVTKTGMFVAGSSTLALASALMVNSYTVVMFLICFVIFGFGAGISYAASISFVLRRWGSSRGYAAGLFESLIGSGYFAGPLIGGMISEYALNAPYIYSCILSLTVFSIQLNLSKRSVTSSNLVKK